MSAMKHVMAGVLAAGACFAFLTFDAHAQDGLRSPVLPEVQPNAPPPQLPPVDLFRVPPDNYRRPPTPYPPHGRGTTGIGWPIYGVGPGGTPVTIIVGGGDADRFSGASSDTGSGFLHLNVTPLTTEVYVDGVYSGRAVDFSTGSGRALRSGQRHIDLRAPGGKSASVDVQVTGGETVSYSGTLESDSPQALPVRAPKKTFYIIERCYAGDSAPDMSKLSDACRAQPVKMVER